MRTRSERAAHAATANRAAHWQAAHDAAREFLERYPEARRRVLVEVQDALTSLAEGELARMEADVAAQPEAARERALTTIREAARELERLDKTLIEQITRGGGRDADDGALTTDELFSLQNNVRFQLARAYRNRALCYLPKSDDRVAALSMAVEQLHRTLSQLRADDPLARQVYLDLAICHRLQGQLEEASRALASPLEEGVAEPIRLHAGAEQVRLALAGGRLEQAQRELDRVRGSAKEASPELDFAQLEAWLALWRAATSEKDKERQRELQGKATATVAYLERTYGPYWGRRGELELLQTAGTAPDTGNVEILGRTAGNLFLKGQFDDAIVAYERAGQQARELGDANAAFTMECRAAAIEQKLSRFDLAQRRLRRAALEVTQHADAPQTHLLAAWNAAQAARADSALIDEYGTILDEHLAQWPASSTSNQAGLWLGQLRESQGKWQAAADAYRHVAPGSEQFESAVRATGRCWILALEEQRAAGQPVQDGVKAATEFFEHLVLGPDRRWPQTWTPAQRAAAVTAARLHLDFETDGYAAAETVLDSALKNASDAPDDWRQTAQALLVVALAGQPARRETASQLLEQFSGGASERLLELIADLSTLADKAPQESRRELAALQLAALDRLAAGQATLSESQRTRLDVIRANALQAAGDFDASLQVRRMLAENHPDDRQIQIDFAQQLLDANDDTYLSQSLDQWRRVAKRLPAGSDDWYRAKVSVALAYYKRNRPGDRALAAERLNYLKATSAVETTRWKSQVDELLQKTEAAGKDGAKTMGNQATKEPGD